MSRLLATTGGLLVVLGAALLSVAFLSPAAELGHADPHTLTTGAAAPGDVLARGLETVVSVGASPAPAPPAAIARSTRRSGLWLEAPELSLALPIVQGDGSAVIPPWKALHYPGTPTPGQPGNSYLYAHGYWGMFGNLRYARLGDRIVIHDYGRGRAIDFHVSRVVGSVPYTDASWLRAVASRRTLTLQTCLGLAPTSDRWIVVATA